MAAFCCQGSAEEATSGNRAIVFSRDIKPLLANHCYACHGPDEAQRKSGLRLDVLQDAISEVIVPGHPEESLLFKRISTDNPEERMPPPTSKKLRLEPQEVKQIRRWIAEGAKHEPHWAYIKPTRPSLPIVRDTSWPRNPIDYFVLKKLEAEGIKPSPQADGPTLIRRLAFDLTGLPPFYNWGETFSKDQRFFRVADIVDHLLASPEHAERLALCWLDWVRYADTNGFHSDNRRDHALYRDYVIEAFMENMPFDQFTVEQLAGDLLPDATTSQQLASGYNRLNLTTREGGSQSKEYRAKYAADRVRNASSVWLGATMGCAECHDHKFDPYSIQDFYSFAAFFADVDEIAVGRQRPSTFPTSTQRQAVNVVEQQMSSLREVMDTSTTELERQQLNWEKNFADYQDQWTVLDIVETEALNGTLFKQLEDGSLLTTTPAPFTETYLITVRTKLNGITGILLEVFPHESLPKGGPGRQTNSGGFALLEFSCTTDGQQVRWSKATGIPSWKDREVEKSTDGELTTFWEFLETFDANPVIRSGRALFETESNLGKANETTLVFTLAQGNATLGRFRLSATTAKRPIRSGLHDEVPQKIADLLKKPRAQRSDVEEETVAAYYRNIAPPLSEVKTQLTQLENRRKEILDEAPKTLVTMAIPPREVRVLARGNWQDDSGDLMSPAIPRFLTTDPLPDKRLTRLDLARWLVNRDNALVARVLVNRLWKLMFGEGLVTSLDDFGTQGSLPSHPELLDWLALELLDSGWDIKHMLQLMANSATYQQRSDLRDDLLDHNPGNRLLAQQNRFRLDAEMIRDNVLAVSGLLSRKIGGPSVKPYQPTGYWAHLNFPKRAWEHDAGPDQYRRGMYTFWCRTFPHPSLLAFGAPSREECLVSRSRSNNPLQALVLLNDPSYVEAAKVFAQNILAYGGQTSEERIAFAFQKALGRTPHPEEIKILSALASKHLVEFASNEKSAQSLLQVGNCPSGESAGSELACWTSVARVIFNLHETITRN